MNKRDFENISNYVEVINDIEDYEGPTIIGVGDTLLDFLAAHDIAWDDDDQENEDKLANTVKGSTSPGAFSGGNTSSYSNASGINDMILAVLSPWNTKGASYPDTNQTSTYTKQIVWPSSVSGIPNAQNVCNGFFLIRPYTSETQSAVLHFSLTQVNGYALKEILQPTMNLAASYNKYRVVSAGLSVRSATTSGTNFNVSGNLNSATMNSLPEVTTLAFSNITSYAENELAYLNMVNVQDGVVVLCNPSGEGQFRQIMTQSLKQSDTEMCVTDTSSNLPTNWVSVAPPVGTPQVVFDSNNLSNFLPPNVFGNFSLSIQMHSEMVTPPGVGVQLSSVKVDFYILDALNGLSIVSQTFDTFIGADPVSAATDFLQTIYAGPLTTPVLGSPSITGGELLRVVVTQANPPGWSMSLVLGSISLKSSSMFSTGEWTPVSVVAYQSVPAGVEIAVNAVVNYEVVPNAALAQNVTAIEKINYHIHDLLAVKYLTASQAELGFKLLMTFDQYQRFVDSGRPIELAKRHSDMLARFGKTSPVRTLLGFLDNVRDATKDARSNVGRGIYDAATAARSFTQLFQ